MCLLIQQGEYADSTMPREASHGILG